jgi:hypothetical protein
MAAGAEQVEKHRRAEGGGEHADGQLGRYGHKAGGEVGEQEQSRAEKG